MAKLNYVWGPKNKPSTKRLGTIGISSKQARINEEIMQEISWNNTNLEVLIKKMQELVNSRSNCEGDNTRQRGQQRYANWDCKDSYKIVIMCPHNLDMGANNSRVEEILDQLLRKADTQDETSRGIQSGISSIN